MRPCGRFFFFFFCRCCCPFALSTSPNPRRNENNTKCALCVCVSRPLEPLSCYVFLLCFVFFFFSYLEGHLLYCREEDQKEKKKKSPHAHTHTHTHMQYVPREKKKITYAASGRRRTVRVSSPSALCTRSSSADTKRCRGGGFSSFNSCSDSRTDWGHLTKKPGIISFRS